ncbi:MAG: transposase [Planctomycetota bacterium]
MSSAGPRGEFTGQEKAAILRAHFVDRLPVSEVCRQYDISESTFAEWQRRLFEGGAELFGRRPNSSNVRRQEAAVAKRVAALEEKIARKDAVIAELLYEHMLLQQPQRAR